MNTFTNWLEDQITRIINQVVAAIGTEVEQQLAALETSLVATIESNIDGAVNSVVSNAATNTTNVINSLGGTITNTMDHFTIDTSALAQAVAQAIKGLLPPFLARKP